MPFEYSCFISYSTSGFVPKVILHLHEALSDEVGALIRDKGVFLDKERLKGGDFWDPTLAEALCKSACMVLVYTRAYFDENHTNCAREFKAMEMLEEMRLKKLGESIDKKHGLIIPIILRGEKYLPEFIKRRQYYNFCNFLNLKDENLFRSLEKYAQCIKDIAEIICDRYIQLSKVCDKTECKDFKIPEHAEVSSWVKEINTNEDNLPYHGGSH